MAGRDDRFSFDALEDPDTRAEILRQVVLGERSEVLNDPETCWRLEDAVERSKSPERARGRPFSRRDVNASRTMATITASGRGRQRD
jgi:hypothetical protein